MRPAVHASILRVRGQRVRRVLSPHAFSMRRLLVLACIGSMFFIPGIVLTIVGLEKTEEELQAMINGQRIMYQAIGPALTSLGLAFLFSACVYYYCYGTGETRNRVPSGSYQKSFQSSVNSDPQHHSHHGQHHHHHHHHGHNNSSQLGTPDGVVRRLSVKGKEEGEEGNHSPHPHSPEAKANEDVEERVPLASCEHVNGGRPHSPSLTLLLDRNTDPRPAAAALAVAENDMQERERLVNGDVSFADSTPA